MVEFLHKKGFADITEDLNQKLTDEQYNLLVAEYSQDKSIREEATRFLQDRISRKAAPEQPVQEEKPAKPVKKEPEMIETVIPAEPVIKFKTVGKINLETPKPEPKEEPVKETPKPVETVKPVVEKKASEPKKELQKSAQPVKKVEPVRQEPKPEFEKPVEVPKAEPVKVEPEVMPAPAAVPEPAAESQPEPKEAPQEEVFKIQTPQNGGLNIKTVGKIDLTAINQSTRPKKKSKEEKKKEREAKEQQRQQQRQQFKESLMKEIKPGDKSQGGSGEPRKKNRVRIGGEKVDLTKADSYNQQGGDNRGKDAQKGGGRNNKDHRFNKADKADFSNEDVNRQIRDTFSQFQKGKTKSSKYRKDKREQVQQRQMEALEQERAESKVLKLTEFVTANELATMMNIPVTQVIATCMNVGVMVSINQRLDAETINIVADEYGFTTDFVSAEVAQQISEEADREEDLVPRAPIVTVMGHVDHGKTSLLDYIRKSNVIAGEAGGITQHIGAYNVKLEDGRHITFLDTPGHEAFTAMRARGAQVTDIAIIIVAADDNVMPQTKEAIAHATAAGVPIVFAINKVDKPAADPERIKQELAQMNFLVEDWGGKYQSQDISAKKGTGVNELMEKVLLEAEMLDLKANPNRRGVGAVIESSLDKGRGYVAKVLVQNGTLAVGDPILAGSCFGKVKAMFNERNQPIKSAGPATPVLLLGLNGAPQAGDAFKVCETEQEARSVATKRARLVREMGLRTQKHITLEEIGRRIAIGDFKELNIIVKGDVDGSVEALSGELLKLSTEQVQVNVIHKSVGAVTETDVMLATASNALIVAFQVRPTAGARKAAEAEQIDIRTYSIIYTAINEIKEAIAGMHSPEIREKVVCNIEVREVFHISKVGNVAGCIVLDGKLQRNTRIRLIRDGIVIYTGKLGSLRRFKDDVKEVVSGQDCGLNIDGCNDIKIGVIIEGYEEYEVAYTGNK